MPTGQFFVDSFTRVWFKEMSQGYMDFFMAAKHGGVAHISGSHGMSEAVA